MRKVIVIGCPGAGKSTFARKLSAVTGLPLYHLDNIWHLPDKTNASREEFDCRLEEIMNRDEWVIDGNYLRTLPWRLKNCDTIFFFDLPIEVCIAGIKDRLGKERDDMPWIEHTLDEDFHRAVVDFPDRQAPEIRKLLDNIPSETELITFHSRAEANSYIQQYERRSL